MVSTLEAYVTLVCTSVVLNLSILVYTYWKRHHYTNIAKLFMWNTLTSMIYCFGYAFSLTSTSLEQLRFWNIVQYVGMPFFPPLGLMFVMHYLGYKLTRKRIIALLIIPCLTFLINVTNESHHTFYRIYDIHSVLGAPYSEIEYGVWFVVHNIYIFSCMLAALLLLLSRWKETVSTYKPQLFALICGQLLPIVAAFLLFIGLTPDGIDPVPMVIWFSSVLYLWSITSSRMLSIMPVAKETIFNSMNDGVIVLNDSYQLIEYNHACKNMFTALDRSTLGQPFDHVWYMLTDQSFPVQLDTISDNLNVTIHQANYIYQLRISMLQQSNNNSGLLIIFTDITELHTLQQKLEHQAYYDELTQIYNRRAFFQQSEQDLMKVKGNLSSYTLILFDIDFFKKVNDTFGHQAGDQILVHVAQICKAELGEDMLFARYGGEEFVLAIAGYTLVEGENFANHLRFCIEQNPLVENKRVVSVTCSFGVSVTTGVMDESIYQLIQKADEALYAAKRSGRNQVKVFTEELTNDIY
ncbi:histidine kinase N-terminal 7TM domain-containing diguanylate cyclase [Paenibacillus endoradicis]|uniref:histidine kinase N-terminal 7TM domain-containing diguanylate cyclase n=1 Tax=Paenibacillus endoradicis TaxID=2972487 RepID=UPI0021596BCD|nr:histidine kinase N-terminal 7TM domain-containing protein [Paenibacillus endoradicis]MCR8657071.1 diguanylate cyclase [Paenibacillus endoradicis]